MLKTTDPSKLQLYCGDAVGVGTILPPVAVGVGVGVNVITLIDIPLPPHNSVAVGVGVGVSVFVGVGVGVGVIGKSHSNIASKDIVWQYDVGVGVGVGHTPGLKKPSHKSGQSLLQGDGPNNIQGSLKSVDKHQQFSVVDKNNNRPPVPPDQYVCSLYVPAL